MDGWKGGEVKTGRGNEEWREKEREWREEGQKLEGEKRREGRGRREKDRVGKI